MILNKESQRQILRNLFPHTHQFHNVAETLRKLRYVLRGSLND